ncbi:uncharacterized protein [Miscanthus floridulus]|uniref:uncharacterized protein n=1 Tax=Miscanthus floridulus TaxID=154761 RepID=UPI003459C0AB
MAPLSWRHHTLLQALFTRGPLSDRDFRAVFAAISGKNPATHHQLFNDTLLKLNKELAYLQFELPACMNQYDGMVYYGVVNNIADEESKLGTKYSVPQVAYYKGLLEAVVQEAGNDGTITSIDALNVRLDNQQKREWQHLYRVHERRSCSGWWFTVSLGSPATHGASSPPAVQFPPAPLFLQASRAAS